MEPWKLNKLHLFPVFLVIWHIIGILVCFWIAYWKGHVSIYVPFISEAGGSLPESGIFTFFLCIGAFLKFFSMLIHYLIIHKLNSQHFKKIVVLNKITFFIGCISLCGIILTGCYPVYSILSIHITAAYLFFFGEIIYGFFQILISLIMQPGIYRSGIFLIRLAIWISALAFFIGKMTAIAIALRVTELKFTPNIAHKMPGDEGFDAILIISVCEWMMVFCFLCFSLSFINDFQIFKIKISIYESGYSEQNLKISETISKEKEKLEGTKKEK